ncbi:MAG: hypothetical protein QMD10_08940 [Desulfitobacteriaceae bacterium]|nr:hypothetical protein [Desulfitobacteriaceae bacterium]
MTKAFNSLLSRSLPEGGFIGRIQGSYRPDATAWAVLALEVWGYKGSILQASRDRLAAEQRPDGRVCLSPAHEDVFWPTSLAILAWQSSAPHSQPKTRAVEFLLKASGKHWPRRPNDAAAHDTALRGWSWTGDTHSWTEPTALAILALKAASFSEHERVQEAEKMLIDRQLPSGGWNYGNTLVFAQELRPMPESTGLALDALSGSVPRQQVEQSLQYLKARITNLKTPRSLAWSLLGLGAWGERPKSASEYVAACLTRSGGYGDYDTPSLALLMLAFSANRGLLSIFKD